MRHPTRAKIRTGPIISITRAVIENPFVEALADLFGQYNHDSLIIEGIHNWWSTNRENGEVDYTNKAARTRLDGFEDALRAKHSRRLVLTKKIGQMHAHPYWTEPLLSTTDRDDVKNSMHRYNLLSWVEIISRVGKIGVTRPVGVYYSIEEGAPVLEVHHPTFGYGIKLALYAKYIHTSGSRLRTKDLPVVINPVAIRKYFITE